MHKEAYMKYIESGIKRTVLARFFEDEDLLETIASTAKQNNVNSAFFFLIGTLKKAVLGYYQRGKYKRIEKPGPLEMGNISVKEEDELVVHGHIVVSDSKGEAFGGHILPGCLVDATAEFVLVEMESGTLRRQLDIKRNLYFLSLGKQL